MKILLQACVKKLNTTKSFVYGMLKKKQNYKELKTNLKVNVDE
jgi:hypothetical protein